MGARSIGSPDATGSSLHAERRFQLMCNFSGTQSSSQTRFMPTVLVCGKEGGWATARTNGILQGRERNREKGNEMA